MSQKNKIFPFSDSAEGIEVSTRDFLSQFMLSQFVQAEQRQYQKNVQSHNDELLTYIDSLVDKRKARYLTAKMKEGEFGYILAYDKNTDQYFKLYASRDHKTQILFLNHLKLALEILQTSYTQRIDAKKVDTIMKVHLSRGYDSKEFKNIRKKVAKLDKAFIKNQKQKKIKTPYIVKEPEDKAPALTSTTSKGVKKRAFRQTR